MGCGSSRKALVGPGDEQNVAWNDKRRVRDVSNQEHRDLAVHSAHRRTFRKVRESKVQDEDRGASATSAHSAVTVDSGLGCDDRKPPGEVSRRPLDGPIPGTMPRAAANDILEELRAQGLIQSTPRVVRGGQAFDVMVTDAPSGRPPARLERLILSAGSTRGSAGGSAGDERGAATAAAAAAEEAAAARRAEALRERRERQLRREERARRVRGSRAVAIEIQHEQHAQEEQEG
ncbi:stathmin domain-containing protein 1 isoform X1 [Lethenteron reissneri]|uniref:stathmin domain-containing protein 1 isoform X1 n=1 Tax=Lethenteron reissneri TaxID=7753 RepID=UPI002AB78CB6|nr:stathmin domain-containing protein 1 isoform X1 [Lethenteron reissneri]XP_061418357.1 stathmin domain-containing protein 1 isoform X1 [Lethenteron reissneri]XP_061418358.1 stathmin domain-containing protein 1 isoform X1 [Lethenteron reissneri]XP_061418359.1 stathmin domain-containing protein 1 isoform X1 [Lethenteron reissneri]